MDKKRRTSRAKKLCVELLENRRLLTTYYVDNAVGQNGSDSNSGTSLSAPFLTIQKAATLAVPGDVVDILAGTYHETVTPAYSGTAAAPITYQAYDGEKVTIDGADPVTGWSAYSGNIYQSSSMNWTMGGQDDQLFVDGQMINYARWPNTSLDVSHPTWELAGPNTTGTVNANGFITETIYDANLTQPAGYWNGATIHIEPGETWIYEAATITNYTRAVVNGVSYGVITYTSSFNTPNFYTAGQGDPYYITGDPYYTNGQFQNLNSPGEFYRDPNTGKVYIWTPGSDSPSSHVIEAKHRLWGFDLSGLVDIDITGINFFACGINSSSSSGHLLINGINAQYVSQFENYTGNWTATLANGSPAIGGTGIILNGGNNTIENSTVAYSAGDGISVWGNNNVVYNNVIHDVDYSGLNCAAITSTEYPGVQSSNDVISYNTVFNGGRSLIDASDMTASHIDNNRVFNAMLQAGDGAGIYAFQANGNGTEIDDNYVSNSQNNINGYPECGIFMDVSSTGFTIDHNLVTNAVLGIKEYDALANNIINNTVEASAISIQLYGDETGIIANNIVSTGLQFESGTNGLTIADNLQSTPDPKFVSPSTGNYQLQSSSPAINAGMVIAPYTNGYVGSAPDEGAYEYGATAWTSGATGAAAVLAGDAIPAPWSAADIGAPAITGNSTYSNGIFAVSGSGTDIWNSADQFQFVSAAVTGDQTIVARVTSQGDSQAWAKAGLMIRSNSSAGSPFVMITTTPGNGVNLLVRDASGGLHLTGAPAIANPVWLKLTRSGNVFTAYDSADGVNWNTVGSITTALPASELIGLAVTSEDATQISTAIFDNVSVPSLGVAAPTGLTIGSASVSSLNLTWNASPSATGYQVQRSTDGVNYTTIATLGTVTSYSDSAGLSASTKYYYRVIATGATGSSAPSGIASASTLSTAPTGLTAVAGYVQTTLSWNAVSGAISYNIYRGTTSGGEAAAPVATGVTGLSYGDTNVRTGSTYYYYVTAVNGNAAPINSESIPSAEVSVSAGIITAVPGTIQVVNYDLGGEGVAYHDTDSVNAGGAYRNDGVDIETSTGGGYDVGWVQAGEWLNYTISVPASGSYMISTSVSSPAAGGTFQINLDGANQSGTLAVPNTGGWETFTAVNTNPITISAGVHVLRLAFDAAASNGWLGNFKAITVTAVSIPLSAPGGLTISSATTSSLNIGWTAASSATGYQVQRSTNGVSFTTIATLGSVTSYTDAGPLSAGTQYYYRVISTNSGGSSSPSGILTGFTLTAAPTGLTAVAGYIQTTLSWASVSGAVSYNLYRGTTSGGEAANPIAAGLTALTYADTAVVTGNTYYYYVTAVNGNAAPLNSESAASAQASVSAGIITAVPAVIQSENYDLGGEGVAYHSVFTTNVSGYYRNDGVAVEQCGDTGGGYDIGTTEAGEWLDYTISVPTTGYFTFSPRVASLVSGGTFHLNIDGVNVSGELAVPNTGAWQTYTTLTTAPVQMTAGVHVLRLAFDTAANMWDGNFNYITVAAAPSPAPTVPVGVTATAQTGSISLAWKAGANDVSYNVYRGTVSGGEGTVPLATGITGNSYTDTTATPGTAYYYTVTGVNASKVESAASVEVSGTSVAAAVSDPSFELTSVNGSYVYDPTTTYWKFTGNAGIEANGSAWSAANAPDGTQAAFLQSLNATSGGTISQSISFAVAGKVEFSFYAAQRTSYGVEPIAVSVDGTVVTTITPGSINFQGYSTQPISLSAGLHTLSFATASTSSSDADSFIDKVAVTVLPNPPSAPGGLTATATSSQINLSWTATAGAVTYNIYRGTSAGGEAATPLVSGVTTTSYADTTAVAGVTYYYTVTSVSSQNVESAQSTEVSAGIPAAVTNSIKITGTPIGTSTSWLNNGDTIAQVFDGNFNSYFDAPNSSLTNWVGLDMGVARTITQIKYAPRAGYEYRMYGGQFQVSNTADFSSGVVTLYTINTIPTAGAFTVISVNPGAAYRYVRFVGGTGWVNIAEMEVDGVPIQSQLTGTPIGTQTSYLNKGDTIAQVFDGNLNTYFDAPNSSLTNWVGLDLGSPQTITQIAFAPRAGYEYRMYGGQFQVSTTADFSSNVVTVYTINSIPTAGVLTTVNVNVSSQYRYIRYVGGTQWVNIAEMQVIGDH